MDWGAVLRRDARLEALGTGTDAAFVLRGDRDVLWLHVREGAIVDHAFDEAFERRVDFGLAAPDEAWEKLLSPVPPPRYQHLFALLSKEPGFRIEGSREAFAQHAHVVARLLAPQRERRAGVALPDLSGVTGRYVRVGDALVHAEQAGAGRDLLCLHTAGSDSRQYHHLMADPELCSAWRLTAFDLPAHGRSTPPAGMLEGGWVLDTDAYVAAIVGAADALELERPVVIGCSMGGEICLELAWRHPDRFAGVIACQASDHIDGRQVAWAKHARVNQAVFVPEWIDGLMGPEAPEPRRAEVRWAYSQGGFGVFWGDIEFYSREWDGRERVGSIDTSRCPVHILGGEYDYSCTPELARATAARIPGATFTELKGLGHFPMAEDPERFLEYLRPVLASL